MRAADTQLASQTNMKAGKRTKILRAKNPKRKLGRPGKVAVAGPLPSTPQPPRRAATITPTQRASVQTPPAARIPAPVTPPRPLKHLDSSAGTPPRDRLTTFYGMGEVFGFPLVLPSELSLQPIPDAWLQDDDSDSDATIISLPGCSDLWCFEELDSK